MKRQLTIIAGLLGLLCLEQAILVSRAVVPAQDAVRYVAMAQVLEAEGLLAGLPKLPEQPLFPIVVWLTHQAAAVLWGDISWAVAVQLAATGPLILCVVPIYATLRQWIGQRGAIAGTLLFCSMEEIARLGADGLSDSTHLLCISLALWAISTVACRSTNSGRPLIAMLCAGFAIGLAALTRIESLVLLPAVALAGTSSRALTGSSSLFWVIRWSGSYSRPDAKKSLANTRSGYREEEPVLSARVRPGVLFWQLPSSGLFAVAVGLLIAWAPSVAIVGHSDSIARLLGGQGAAVGQVLNSPLAASAVAESKAGWKLPNGEPMTFSKKDNTVSSRFRGSGEAIVELGRELTRTIHPWIGGLALLGLAVRRAAFHSFDRLAICFSALLVGVATFYAAQVGYLSSRHLLLLTPFVAGYAGLGAVHLGRVLAAWAVRHRWFAGDALSWRGAATRWSVVAVAVIAGLMGFLTPLHASRWGHRQAAERLASAAEGAGSVLDTRGWTALYTARPTYRLDAAESALADPQLAWLVVEAAELAFDSPRGRTLRHLTESYGQLLHTFRPPHQRDAHDEVRLYRIQLPVQIAHPSNALAVAPTGPDP